MLIRSGKIDCIIGETSRSVTVADAPISMYSPVVADAAEVFVVEERRGFVVCHPIPVFEHKTSVPPPTNAALDTLPTGRVSAFWARTVRFLRRSPIPAKYAGTQCSLLTANCSLSRHAARSIDL